MNAAKHMKIAGALQILQSIPLLIFSLYYISELSHALKEGSQELGESTEVILMILLFTLLFLIGGVLVWFGHSLIRQKPWTSRVGGVICCVPGILSFPHIISVYTLWVCLQSGKEE